MDRGIGGHFITGLLQWEDLANDRRDKQEFDSVSDSIFVSFSLSERIRSLIKCSYGVYARLIN